MNDIIIANTNSIMSQHKNEHKDYEYYKNMIVDGESGGQCNVSIYKIPPGKAAYPYHYHTKNEEVFYIISGTGILKTPLGEQTVTSGDVLAFPANKNGAHKLINSSETEMLIYLDFDTYNSPEISHLLNSGKVVVYGRGFRQIFKESSEVGYYDGE
jgi:uncharacterized cupin superfamily protein